MSTKESGENPFRYQDKLTYGSRHLACPGLMEVPDLEATLAIHREYLQRIRESDIGTWDEEKFEVEVDWSSSSDQMSRDILLASRTVDEIKKALNSLDQAGHADHLDEEVAMGVIALKLLLKLGDSEGEPDAADDTDARLIYRAQVLTKIFDDLEGEWTVRNYHNFAERVADWDPSIRVVTMDEYEAKSPEIPSVEGLRDWNWYGEEDERDLHEFDTEMLVEECRMVLQRLADLILRIEDSKALSESKPDR